MSSSSLAAAINTIRKHRPRVLGITVEFPIDPSLKISTRDEVSKIAHCLKILEWMLPRGERLKVIGLENHCRLASRWLQRERGSHGGLLPSSWGHRSRRCYMRDFRFTSSSELVLGSNRSLPAGFTLGNHVAGAPNVRGCERWVNDVVVS
jgi:hypothetical protein